MIEVPALDIVIPSRGEHSGIASTLHALLADGSGISLSVVIVLNGEGAQATRRNAARFESAFAAAGHTLTIISVDVPGKPAALNAGDRLRSGANVIYLDADAILLPGSLRAIADALATNEPRLVGARLEIIRPDGFMSACFSDVWSALPGMQSFVGGGCYAVNESGRARWGKFPDLIADDTFVFSRFATHEWSIAQGAAIWFRMPSGTRLLRTIKRWRHGNRQLKRIAANPVSRQLNWAWTKNHWRLAYAIGPFLAVRFLSFLVPNNVRESSWSPERDAGLKPIYTRKIKIRVVVITFNSEELIVRCLKSLNSEWADLELMVVDNSSIDNSIEEVMRHFPNARLIKNSSNSGFASAVNIATQYPGDFDYILLCNPDIVVEKNAIDTALSLSLAATRTLIGGRMTNGAGELDHTSALAHPNLWHALVFASAIAAVPGLRTLDPDWLGGWRRQGTREVPAISGAFCLICADLWRELNGLDTQFFQYGEDVDFSIRARRLGANLLHSGEIHYTHHGGASSANPTERMIRILRGQRMLYSRYAGPFGRHLLLTGVALRAGFEALQRSDRRWRSCWARRKEWCRKDELSFDFRAE